MSEAYKHLQYRRLRAPTEPDSVLATPSTGQWLAPLRDGAPPAEPWQLSIDRAALIAETREQALAAAIQYSRAYRDVDGALGADRPWIASGHQPRLFHPGVWIKNFVLSSLARQTESTPLNLVVDNDLATEHGLAVPVRGKSGWTRQIEPWGKRQSAIPYEECWPAMDDTFRSFPDRVQVLLSRWEDGPTKPLLMPLWERVLRHANQQRPLGECLARARHGLEAEYGLQTLELPLSQLFDLPSTRRWMAAILERTADLHRIYNRSLKRFRQLHRIRSRSHPVPDLGRRGGWHEAPFWIWSVDDPVRRTLWLRQSDQWELTDRQGSTYRDARLVSLLERVTDGGAVKIRPRALMTTLFARTVLADRFIHGIGGAKYDQLNDAIMAEFLGIEPPPFLTLTATTPLVARPIAERRRQIRDVERQLRDLTYNPQRCLEAELEAGSELPARARGLLHSKSVMLQAPSSVKRHQGLAMMNRLLQPYVADHRQTLEQEREQLRAMLRDDLVLGSRETSFALFDEQKLPKKLLDLAKKVDKLSIV